MFDDPFDGPVPLTGFRLDLTETLSLFPLFLDMWVSRTRFD